MAFAKKKSSTSTRSTVSTRSRTSMPTKRASTYSSHFATTRRASPRSSGVVVVLHCSHRSRVRGSFIDDYKFDRDLERDRPRRMRHYHDYGYDYSLDYDTLGLTDDIHGRDPSPRRPIHGPTDFETYESEFLPPRAPHRTTEPRKYTSYLYDDELVAGVPASRVRYPTKALIIGLNYRGKGPKRELDGCINDAMCLQKFLELQGWPTDRRQMMVMTDDSVGNTYPSRQNVISALQWLMEGASPGDALFFSFSGHGGQVVDTSGDEADGMDEVLITADLKKVTDDDLQKLLVKHLPTGALLTCVIDCCHAGTALDLPENYAIKNGTVKPLKARRRKAPSGGQVVMFSGCKDEQESFGTTKGAFAGGACTNAILSVLGSKGPHTTYRELLHGMNSHMTDRRLHQQPSLASNRPLDLDAPVTLAPTGQALQPLPRGAPSALNPLLGLVAADGNARRARGGPGPQARGWFDDVAGGAMDALQDFGGDMAEAAGGAVGGGGFSPDQIAEALKGALKEGVQHAVQAASAPGGFLDNFKIRIPFPEEANEVKWALEKVGQADKCDEIADICNRSAEQASGEAFDILTDGVLGMSLADAKAILMGEQDEATHYMRETCYDDLAARFAPVCAAAMEATALTRYWDDVIGAYNGIPFVPDISFDLDWYVVRKALDGLFTLIGDKEAEIRDNPGASFDSLVQNVFQWKNDGAPE